MAKRRAWVSQLKRHVEQYGADNAAWYVNWIEPSGKRKAKSCGAGAKGKKLAETRADKLHAELVSGVYDSSQDMTWAEFRKRYEAKVVSAMAGESAFLALSSLDAFERVASPNKLSRITTETVDEFRTKRLAEAVKVGGARIKATGQMPTRKGPERRVSPATVNKNLRYLRAALRTAGEWGLIDKVPRVRMLREPQRLATYIPEDHFAAIYAAVGAAAVPDNVPNVAVSDWWRGLLVFAYMTGWRIGQILALRWADVDLEGGYAITRSEHNKGKRDMRIPLHPMVVEHLRPLRGGFAPEVFPWAGTIPDLWHAFVRIQKVTKLVDGSPLPKGGRSGGWYGFHDLRRAFATMNAAGLSVLQLQTLMQHADLTTTRKYVNMAAQLRPAVDMLHVPAIRGVAASG